MKENRERYYKFSNYLKERFGCRVYKVSVDAGFSCPNKDGKISREGCLYCDNRAFSFVSKEGACGDEFSNGTHIPPRPVEKQIEEGIASGRRKFAVEKFIVYFQAHSNTYATLDILKEKYDAVKKFKDIIGIAIGTRPDCINEETLNLIESYTQDYEVWIEYGLQSIHEKTLEFINRGHVYKDFLEAVRLTRGKRNIKICAHLIIGLPNETRENILQTAVELGRLKLEGIKIHPLHVIRGTKLDKLLSRGSFTPLD
ncbi:MAG: TIGR01212 family radical SAM protein, partial [Candidatus Omnitrophica bacterium]|nr:TIGR01212 family radical SAM protein [Candidatus Omnitrophota bacterium]